jgi:hypothetical protein
LSPIVSVRSNTASAKQAARISSTGPD